MIIVGCDFHTRYQRVAMLDPTIGEIVERRLEHATGEARAFYASLPKPARIGIEATGHAQWRCMTCRGSEVILDREPKWGTFQERNGRRTVIERGETVPPTSEKGNQFKYKRGSKTTQPKK